jgi:hypothetical protein
MITLLSVADGRMHLGAVKGPRQSSGATSSTGSGAVAFSCRFPAEEVARSGPESLFEMQRARLTRCFSGPHYKT